MSDATANRPITRSMKKQVQVSIYEACRDGLVDDVAKLLAAGVDVNTPDKDGYTPLAYAGKNCHTDVVRLLLAAKDIDVNKTGDSWTPLITASMRGHAAIVRLLLAAQGIDIYAENSWGNTAFDMACKEHHDDIAQLIANAVSVDEHEQASNFLLKALRGGVTKAADTLLAKGAKLDDKYALLNDVARGNLDAVCKAYDDAGYTTQKPKWGYRDFDDPFDNDTFLQIVVKNRDAAMFKALVDRYVDLNWEAGGEDTMLHTYVEFNDVRSIDFLLEHGKTGPSGRKLKVNAYNYNWYTPLMLAVGEGKTDAFEAIMRARKHYELNLECAIMNGCNETALTMACGNGNVKVVKMLLEAGAKPRAFDSRADPDIDSEYYGISPLQSCIGSNRLTMSKWRIAFMLMDHMSEDDWKFNELVKQKGEYSNDYDAEATVIRWHTLSRKWLPAWRISNFWWKVAGEGQHGPGGRGRKRSLVEYARDPIASKSR